DENLVAKLQLIANVANAMLGDLADVQQAVGAGEELDEGAELGETHNFTEVGLADLGGGCNFADHGQSGIAAGAASREDVHGAVFHDVDLHAGLLDDGLDFLSARTDEVSDLVGRNVQLVEPRRVGRNRFARGAQSLPHDVEDFESRFFRLS